MNDHEIRRIDKCKLVASVRDLFRGNNDLIQGFDIFLPEKYRLDEKQSQPTVMPALSCGSVVASGTDRVKKYAAWDYLQRVKERFQDRQGTYMEFLLIMKDYERERYCFNMHETLLCFIE